MEVKIDNMHIVKKIEDVNISNLELYDQVLLMHEKNVTFENGEKNIIDTENLFLEEITLDSIYTFTNNYIKNDIHTTEKLYSFDSHKFIEDIDEDNKFDNHFKLYNEVDFKQNESCNFLNINNKLFPLTSLTICGKTNEDLEDNCYNIELKYLKQILDKLSEYNNLNSNYSGQLMDLNNEVKEVIFYLNIEYKEHSILIVLYNKINIESLTRSCDALSYFISKDKDIVRIQCDIEKLLDELFKLNNNGYSMYFKEFYDITFKTYKYDIEDYLKDHNILYDYYLKTFQYYMNINIEKFFEPVYTDNKINFKGYLDSIKTTSLKECNYTIGGKLIETIFETAYMENPEKYDNAVRITKAMVKHAKENSYINPYKGTFISDKYDIDEEYRDAEGLVISVTPLRGFGSGYSFNKIFIKIDDYYVEPTHDESERIKERKKIVDILKSSENTIE